MFLNLIVCRYVGAADNFVASRTYMEPLSVGHILYSLSALSNDTRVKRQGLSGNREERFADNLAVVQIRVMQ